MGPWPTSDDALLGGARCTIEAGGGIGNCLWNWPNNWLTATSELLSCAWLLSPGPGL